MILEKISSTKLKVTFYSSEPGFRALFGLKPNSSSPELKAFLITLVKYAASKTGFETGGSVAVQSVQKSDRLIFFITRIIKKQPLPRLPKSSAAFGNDKDAFFSFADNKAFADFLCAVKNEDFSAALLYTLAGKYYFKVPRESRLFNNALEFTDSVVTSAHAAYIKNNAHLICRGDEFADFF